MKRFARSPSFLAVATVLGLHAAPGWSQTGALIVNDTLTGNASTYNWQALGGACLTAGDANTSGNIPSCSSLAANGGVYNGKTQVGGVTGRIYPTPDPLGQGALRLTNGDTSGGSNGDYTTGAVVSKDSFPTSQGVQVTWTSVTYGGDGNNTTGADGMTFFLADAGDDPKNPNKPSVGATGGSLGYSCSNGNPVADGVYMGYLGIGIDEYGNFGNKGDSKNKGDNTNTGPGVGANRIGLRGAGSTNWKWLRATYPQYYPSSLSAADQVTAVQMTCRAGTLYDFSNGVSKASQLTTKTLTNYGWLTDSKGASIYSDIVDPTTKVALPIANQEATNLPLRSKATPIVFSLRITSDGLMDFSYSYNGGTAQNVVTARKITDSNGPLPKNFLFGFSAGTGGGSNVHEITCFKATPASLSSASSGSNDKESGRVIEGSQLFLSNYHPNNWWGQVTAQSLVYDSTKDTLSVASAANWDAGCGLTGGTCSATGGTSVTALDPKQRSILTWNGSTGVPFEWDNLASTQQAALTAGDATKAATRLNYLRGDRSQEASNTGGTFRTRTSVLGDVIDSGPTWVGPPGSPYTGTWADKLNTGAKMAEGSSYAKFATDNATRMNVVYAGSNDGLLHGFRAGSFDANGNFVATKNDGKEVLAYMPSQVLSTIHSTTANVDFGNTQYSHNFFVDGATGTGDLYYNKAWHTWVVGGLGPGGQAGGPVVDPTASAGGSIYMLDVTDPTQFAEGNASTLVVGEVGATTFTSCVNLATKCNDNFGQVYGTPLVRRLHDGNWAMLFGNGLNSTSGSAGLFILHIDSATGNRTLRYLDTGYGTSKDPKKANNRNGIVQVSSADFDGDHVTDYVYAGDVFGNLWRFDLTSGDPAKWSAGSAPIFSTPAGQPITTRVTVTQVPASTNGGRVIVAFGTGQKFSQTLKSAESYASGTQALYGIWDWNMAAWNKLSGTQLESLGGSQAVDSTKLQAQSVTSTLPGSGDVTGYRKVSSNVVCWSGSTLCKTGNTQFGWTLPLPTSTEQVTSNPSTIGATLFSVNTIIPATQQVLTCADTPASGYSMEIMLASGGAAASSVFQGPSGNFTTDNISGIAVGGTGTMSVMGAGTQVYVVQQSLSGGAAPPKKIQFTGGSGQRVNWTKLR